MKSMLGYGLAAIVAYVLWLIVSRVINEKEDISSKYKPFWRTFQWFSTGFLWYTWLSHDVANIAVYFLNTSCDCVVITHLFPTSL